jgi:hypothetical protein
MVFINTENLAIAYRDLDELSTSHERPATSSRTIVADVRSVIDVSISTNRPDFTVKTNRHLGHGTLNSNDASSLWVHSINVFSSED